MTGALPDSVPARLLSSRIRRFQERVFVAGPEQAFELTGTGGFVYRLIDGRRSVRDIGAMVAEEYDIDIETAIADVAEMVTRLAVDRVIELRSSVPGDPA
jgi:hypothetical protein